ncbi:MAG TPA: lysophospholipid acyltransferase family protein [Syntrophorhabdales bacterium]|nr:lysophospholipid acyltransferase family protein [Syntrophorhabdales bacterium]
MLVDLFLLLAIKLFQQFLRILPETLAAGVGAFLGRATLRLLSRRREVALANVRKIVKGIPEAQAKDVVRSCFEKLGINFVELLLIPYLPKEDFPKRFHMENVHFVEKATSLNKGILALVFHYGNWEIMGIASFLLKREVITLARPLKGQKFLQGFINHLRAATGLTVIPNQDTARDAMKYLREGRIVAILGDQREKRSKGVYVELFGEKVPTSKGIVMLAMRTGSPVIPVYLRRGGFLRYTIVFCEPIEMERKGNVEELIYKNTRKINAFLEGLIATHPDEWFLVHRRWGRDAY